MQRLAVRSLETGGAAGGAGRARGVGGANWEVGGRLLVAAMAVVGLAQGAEGLVIYNSSATATGLENSTAPAGAVASGFASVGWRGVGSAIYLGNKWALTAFHVGAGPIDFGLGSVDYDPNSVVRLTDPSSGQPSDLLLYQLVENPGVPAAIISQQTLTTGTATTLVGAGLTRSGPLLRYNYYYAYPNDPNNNELVWQSGFAPTGTVSPAGGAYYNVSGFALGGRAKLWGTSTIATNGYNGGTTFSYGADGFGTRPLFQMNYGPLLNRAQAYDGDSGGAVFSTSTGQLIGLIDANGRYPGQPANTALTGQTTFAIDLSQYSSQILSYVAFQPGQVVPEPTSAVAVCGLAAMALRRSRGSGRAG